MSVAAGDGQAVELTIEELQVLRGAFNVVCELLSRPGLEVPPGLPISREREALFNRIADRLERRVEQADREPVREVLTPAEAQAVRDVAGGLEVLLQDPIGRERLVEVGFLVSADQVVEQAEVEMLQDILNRIEPTGVREAPGVTPARGSALERIDIIRGETDFVLDDPIESQADLEANFMALNLLAADCDSLLADYAELAQIAAQVAAGGEPDRPDFGERAGMLISADEVADDLVDRIRDVGCLDFTTLATLEDSFSLIISAGTARGDLPTELNSFLSQLRRRVAAREEDEERGPTELIDPTQPLDTVIERAVDEIAGNRELPWPGFEQAGFILQDVIDAFEDGVTGLSCDRIFKSVVEMTKLAVAGARRLDGPPRGVAPFVGDVEAAYEATFDAIEAQNCVREADLEQLSAEADEVVDTMRGEFGPGARATTLLRTLQRSHRGGTGTTVVGS